MKKKKAHMFDGSSGDFFENLDLFQTMADS